MASSLQQPEDDGMLFLEIVERFEECHGCLLPFHLGVSRLGEPERRVAAWGPRLLPQRAPEGYTPRRLSNPAVLPRGAEAVSPVRLVRQPQARTCLEAWAARRWLAGAWAQPVDPIAAVTGSSPSPAPPLPCSTLIHGCPAQTSKLPALHFFSILQCCSRKSGGRKMRPWCVRLPSLPISRMTGMRCLTLRDRWASEWR